MRANRWILLAVIVALGALSAGAAEAERGEGPASRWGGRVFTAPGGDFFMVPGYATLSQESVQKQVELVPEQKERLREIAKKYLEEMQSLGRRDWSKWADLSAEERQAQMQEMQKKYADAAAAAKKAVEDILLPHQIEKLKQIELRNRLPGLINVPNILERIGLSDEQKDRLRKLREEQQRKMTELMQETLDKSLDVLTPEQRKKLEELAESPWGALGGFGGFGGARGERPDR